MAPRKTDSLIPLQELDLQIHRLKVQAAEKPRQLAAVEEKLLAGLDDEQRAELLTLLRRIADNAGLEGCAEIGGVEDAGFGDAA